MLQKCAAAGSNKNLRPKVTLQSIHPPTPFQLTMGYVYVEPSSGGYQYLFFSEASQRSGILNP